MTRYAVTGETAARLRERMAMAGMTTQERRVVWLYIHGVGRNDIAAHLGFSPTTASRYVFRAARRLAIERYSPIVMLRVLSGEWGAA